MSKVLLIGQNTDQLEVLRSKLLTDGHEIKSFTELQSAYESAITEIYDIILMAGYEPDRYSFEFSKKILQLGRPLPVLFATNLHLKQEINATRTRVSKILGLPSPQREVTKFGPLEMRFENLSATYLGKSIRLGRREFEILNILAQGEGQPVPRKDIASILQATSESYQRTIDSHMSHLRRKMQTVAQGQMQIVSVYGVGYRLQLKAGLQEETDNL